MKIESEEAQRIAVEEILPRLSFLKELTLTFTEEAGPFCTSSLPSLPELKGLTVRGLRSYSHHSFSWDNSPLGEEISLLDLDRQSSLESVCLVKPTALSIEDPKAFLSKIRLQGIYDGGDYGKIDQIDAKSLRKINPAALKVLLINRLDHGKSNKPPAWWQDNWTSDPVVSDVYGAVEHAQVNPYWSDKDFISLIEFKTGKKRTHKVPVGHEIIVVGGSKWAKMTDWVFPGDRLTRPLQDQTLDLSGIESFTGEMIQLIYDSAIPVRLRGDALTEELASVLSSRKGRIELVGGSSTILSSALKKRRQANVLDFSEHKLADGTIAAMNGFAGEELTVVLSGTLAKAQATALAGLPFPLVLSCGHDGLVAIPDAAATALAKRDAPTRLWFHRSRDLLGGGNPDHFRLSKEAVGELEENENFDLGLFGTTMLVKESGKSSRFMQLTTYSVSGKDKMVLETISGVVGGSSRASSKVGNVYDKKKKIVEQLMKEYQFA